MEAKVIRCNGAIEQHKILAKTPHTRMVVAKQLIGAQAIDTVVLTRKEGMADEVMLVDDQGHWKKLPENEEATRLYHGVCRPGTTHQIRGDVVIVHDADLGEEW